MEALQKLRQVKMSDELGFQLPQKDQLPAVPFNQLAEEVLNLIKKTHTPKSFERYLSIVKCHLAPYFKDILLAELTPRLVETYKSIRLDYVKPVTVAHELRILHAMLQKAVRWRYITENPMDFVDKIKPINRDPDILTPEQVQEFFKACADDFLPLAMTYYYAGLRKSEAFNLTWDDVQMTEKRIRIRGEVSKNKRTSYIPMNIKLREVLLEQKKKTGKSEWVFPGMYGQQRATCQKAFREARRKAGIDSSFRMHDLRHTWASHLLHAGVDPKLIQEWAGWHSIKMLDRYGHPDRKDQMEKIDRI